MTSAQRLAHKLRFVLLLLALACFGVWVWWIIVAPFTQDGASVIGTPAMWGMWLSNSGGWKEVLAAVTPFVGLILLAQWLLLRPSKGWLPKMANESRPMRTSVIGAAFFAMLLTTGTLTTLMELPNLWEPVLQGGWTFLLASAVMLVIWIAWAAIFFIYWKQGDRYTQLGRMIRGLIAGSFAETLVATGVFAWNPHHEDCYCARGSYTGLIFGGTVLAWCFGPGVILLFLREKHRRLTAQKRCQKCGYDLRGTIDAGRDSCPECGARVVIAKPQAAG